MNDLIYQIYSLWLYPNQLNHDYVFLHNHDLYWLFSNGEHSANHKIYKLHNSSNLNDKEIKERSIFIMKESADKSGVLMIKSTNFITVKPNEEYIFLSNKHYKVYDIYWNETKSGINPHDYKQFSNWNIGNTTYSSYRIEDFKEKREIAYKAWWRDKQINSILE
jgi:hypothetical protein